MPKLRILSVDPSFTNWGMAKFYLDLGSLELDLLDLELVTTERTKARKIVRVNSDDLARSATIWEKFLDWASETDFIFSEVPSGAQDANAAKSFGICIGLLAAAPKPLIQVMPLETKLAATNTKNAGKPEIMRWAYDKYPNAPWKRDRDKPNGRLLKSNEHLADACAIAEAGILTDEFRRLIAALRVTSAAAA